MGYVVVDDETFERRSDYIGEWYDGQYMPQSMYIEIDPSVPRAQAAEIGVSEYGGGVPEGVWNGRRLRVYLLGCFVLSHSEADMIINESAALIDALLESYEERGEKGYWNMNLKEELENEWADFRSELGWVSESELKQEV